MKHGIYSNDGFDAIDNDFDEDEDEEQGESQDFGIDSINKRRCAQCKTPLLRTLYEGFTVWYCPNSKEYVCDRCYHPALTRSGTSSDLVCTKCGKVYTHTSTR